MKTVYGVIYLLIDGTNDKEYVGQTTRTVEERFKEHANYNNSYIDNAIRAHGADMFVVAVLKECANKEELDFWERYLIRSRNTIAPNGYNLTDGGEGGIPCDETRAKMSAALKGRPKSPETRAKLSAASATLRGEKNPFFGHHHTDETRAKISASKIGKHLSEETRAKMSAVRKGVPKSPEHRAKMSVSRMGAKNPHYGKKNTPEHQAKIVAANLGAKRTPETCARISAALTGKPFTAERCANISAAQRGDSPYKNLLRELDAHKLSYHRLAELLNLAQSIISRKMHCKRNFTIRDRIRLEEIFGKPADYLLERDDG